MKSKVFKILIAIASAGILFGIGWQVFTAFYDPYESVTVKQGTYEKKVELSGYFVRDEKALTVEQPGAISYAYKNGERAARESELLRIYKEEETLQALEQLDELSASREILSQINQGIGSDGLNLDLVKRQLSDVRTSLMHAVDDGAYSELNTLSQQLLLCLNRYKLCIGEDLSLETTIAELDKQIAEISKTIPQPDSVIKTDQPGYFCSSGDGLESTYTVASIDSITVDSVHNVLLNKENVPVEGTSTVGKMVHSNTWYFVSEINADDAEYFKKGKSIPLSFASHNSQTVDTTVENILIEEGKETAVVVFKGDTVNAELLSMRFETPSASVFSYSGIIVPKEAVRIERNVNEEGYSENQKIVYALLGKTVRSRKLDIIYEDENVVVSRPSEVSGYVSAYDQVIIKGRELNDTTQ